jgi:hypothetical protein
MGLKINQYSTGLFASYSQKNPIAQNIIASQDADNNIN